MTAAKTRRINARLPPDIARKVAYLERRTKMSTTEIVTESIDRYYAAIVDGGLAGPGTRASGLRRLRPRARGSLRLVQGRPRPFHRQEDVILADTGF